MAQYDLILTQNVSLAGTEFSEKTINLTQGSLLTSNGARDIVPLASPGGAEGAYFLSVDDIAPSGLAWISKFSLLNYSGAEHMDNKSTSVATDAASDVKYPSVKAVKTYADGLFAANDAMLFKGTIGTGGTLTIAAFNALTTYNAGWTYRVIEAGTIRGVVSEIGDLVMVVVDRIGSGNVNSDFTIQQTNIDGAVLTTRTINGKALSANITLTPDDLVDDATTHKFVFAADLTKLGNLSGTNSGDETLATIKSKLGITTLSGSNTGDQTLPTLISLGVNATAAELNALDGITATVTELNYVNGVTSAIQTQLDGKATSAQGTLATNAIPKNIFTATGNQIIVGSGASTYSAFDVPSGTLIGRNNTGNITALSAYSIINLILSAPPTTNTSAGFLNQLSFDANYGYICTVGGVLGVAKWARWTLATNW